MVKILNCYLYAKKSYGTLSKGAIFFWPTLYKRAFTSLTSFVSTVDLKIIMTRIVFVKSAAYIIATPSEKRILTVEHDASVAGIARTKLVM